MCPSKDAFDWEQWTSSIELDVNGSFLSSKRTNAASSSNPSSSDTVTSLSVSNGVNIIVPSVVPSRYHENSPFQEVNSSHPDWNICAIMRGDGTERFTQGKFYGSSSMDGASIGFWEFDWDTFVVRWKPGMNCQFVSWPYRAVTRSARATARSGTSPSRLCVAIEGYSQLLALTIIKNEMRSWCLLNSGFCLIIGGPAARESHLTVTRYFVRCFGKVPFSSSGRSCLVDALLNASFLLLGDQKSREYSEKFILCLLSASRRCRPHNEGKIEVSDLINLGHIGPIFQELGGDLGVRRVRNIPAHDHLQHPRIRFNWIFNKELYRRLYVLRLNEPGIVDHVVIVDCRQWPSLIYDSADLYPVSFSSISLFFCAGPDASKVKVSNMYEIFRHQRRGEDKISTKRISTAMPRGSKRSRSIN